jgi:hypothetical protein
LDLEILEWDSQINKDMDSKVKVGENMVIKIEVEVEVEVEENMVMDMDKVMDMEINSNKTNTLDNNKIFSEKLLMSFFKDLQKVLEYLCLMKLQENKKTKQIHLKINLQNQIKNNLINKINVE